MEAPRRDALHSAIANNLSTSASLFISFLVAFVVLSSTTPDIARYIVISLGLLLLSLGCAIAGGTLIAMDTDDARNNPSTSCPRSSVGIASTLCLVLSGIFIVMALVYILPFVVCEQFDFDFQQSLLNLQFDTAVNGWNRSSAAYDSVSMQLDNYDEQFSKSHCRGFLIGFIVFAVSLPFVVFLVVFVIKRQFA